GGGRARKRGKAAGGEGRGGGGRGNAPPDRGGVLARKGGGAAEGAIDVLHEPVRERAPPRPPQLRGVLAGEEPAEVGPELDAEEERGALDHGPAAHHAESRADEEDGRAGPGQSRARPREPRVDR